MKQEESTYDRRNRIRPLGCRRGHRRSAAACRGRPHDQMEAEEKGPHPRAGHPVYRMGRLPAVCPGQRNGLGTVPVSGHPFHRRSDHGAVELRSRTDSDRSAGAPDPQRDAAGHGGHGADPPGPDSRAGRRGSRILRRPCPVLHLHGAG